MEKQRQLLTLSQAAYNNKEYQKVIDILEGNIKVGFESALGYYLLGEAYAQIQQFKKAVESYKLALKCDERHQKTYIGFAEVLTHLKHYHDALKVLIAGVRQYPKESYLHNKIGILYEYLGKNAQAHEAYFNALKVDPTSIQAINNRAILFYRQKKYAQASELFSRTLTLDANYVQGYSNLGASLHRQGRYEEAIGVLEKAIKKQPNQAGAYTNLGNVYSSIYAFKKAQSLHEKAIELAPNFYKAHANLGSVLNKQGENFQAIKCYKKALTHNPDFIDAHFDLATTFLKTEAFKEGFKEYEWRFKKPEMVFFMQQHKEIFSKPMLHAQSDAKGKIVLIHSEQGFGDSLMFVRFIPHIKKQFGCKVIFKVRDELGALFENNCQIDEVVLRSQKTPEFDFHLPIMSAAYILGIKTQEEFLKHPYLFIQSSNPHLKISQKNKKPTVGICWSASVTGESYEGKVFDLRHFTPLLQSDKIAIYSLQVGDGKEDIAKYSFENSLIDLSDFLTDFEQTAILVKQLDLVITSDTSVAHLCGALGVKTWVLLQKYPDWRWGNKGETSYMYGSVKLLRQKTNRNWDSVFQSVYDRIQLEFKLKLQ